MLKLTFTYESERKDVVVLMVFLFWVYKNNSYALSSIIAYFFNYFFQVGQFPLAFKFADVIPIPKCSKPLSPEKFRPIAMLPVLSKVMEKIAVSKWILPTIKSKLQPSQFAYTPRSGCGAASALTLINHHTCIFKFLDLKSGAGS